MKKQIIYDNDHGSLILDPRLKKDIPPCVICGNEAIGNFDGSNYCVKCCKERYPGSYRLWKSEKMQSLMRKMKAS